jgi:uncharacterized protein YndB with AHSA1/START domain
MLTALFVLALLAAAAIAIVLLLAAAKPDTFRVERTATIAAPPERIFPLINDFRQWQNWSPFEKLDPAMTKTMSGSASGKGAIYEWKGNRKAGEGRMEIAEVSAPSEIDIDLRFVKPFRAHNTAEFRLEPQGGATKVTWAMRGKRPLVAKVMGMVLDFDKMIGRDFETGLANLKAIAER